MVINTTQQMDEYLRVQMQQSQAPRQLPSGQTSTFTDLLNEALTKNETQGLGSSGLAPSVRQSEMISQMLLNPIEAKSATDPDTDLLQSAFDSASGTLDLWDSYAKKIGSYDDNSLRDAYSILQNIGDQVSQLKSNAANLLSQNANFNSLVNELDIMATTERIKFNRGDYA